MSKDRKRIQRILYHILVCGFGLIMIYPLVWMVMSSFKPTNTIFTTASNMIPEKFVLENYITGWKGFAGVKFGTFFKNSLLIAVLGTIGTLLSSACVAYAFSRCKFRGRKFFFGAMMTSMMIPGQILMVPQYLWYQKLNWIGGYAPLIVPFCFAIQGFFVYMLMNFIQGIPRELDEAAKIDGCSYYGIFWKIILPLVKTAMVTAGIFSFMWRWDDFMSALLYINDAEKYPASLALKLFSDPGASTDYGAMFAMATLSLLPIVTIFIVFQKYLADGIATSGLKG